MTSQQILIDQIREEIPNAQPSDIVSLIELMHQIHNQKFLYSKTLNPTKSLHEWYPHQSTVLDALTLSIEPIELIKAIESFRDYANHKSFTSDGTLDDKFITHIKYLIKSGRVSTKPT